MLVDLRTYRVKPGYAQAQMDVYEKYGFPTQVKYCGEPIAYLSAESGELNTLVHLWAFEDAGDRAQRRAAMTTRLTPLIARRSRRCARNIGS